MYSLISGDTEALFQAWSTKASQGKNKRLLLIEPPFFRLHKADYSLTRLPLSLGYLAGMVKKHTDWQVMIYNADFCPKDRDMLLEGITGPDFAEYLKSLEEPTGPVWQEVSSTIEAFQPTLVGITSKSQNFASTRIIAEKVKSLNKSVIVVVGGPHACMLRGEILRDSYIDVAVFGEGELTILDLIQVVEGKKSLQAVDGIAFRKQGGIVETSPRAFIDDLDSLVFPVKVAEETLKDYPQYPSAAFENILAIRGCPNNCSFCGSRYIWSRVPRFRSTSHVVEEIREIMKLGVSVVNFDDDTFGCRKSYIKDLCVSIKANFPALKWSCWIHVSLVDPNIIRIMREAGCYLIRLGVESGNNRILKEIRKGITIEQAFKAAETIRKAGVTLFAYFLIGFPQDTLETLNDTVHAMKTMPAESVCCSIFTPYPGTELFRYCLEQGIIKEDFDVSRFNHHSPLNYFCPNIPREVFLKLARETEIEIFKLNSRKRLRRAFSQELIVQLKRYGIRKSLSDATQNVYSLARSRVLQNPVKG